MKTRTKNFSITLSFPFIPCPRRNLPLSIKVHSPRSLVGGKGQGENIKNWNTQSKREKLFQLPLAIDSHHFPFRGWYFSCGEQRRSTLGVSVKISFSFFGAPAARPTSCGWKFFSLSCVGRGKEKLFFGIIFAWKFPSEIYPSTRVHARGQTPLDLQRPPAEYRD